MQARTSVRAHWQCLSLVNKGKKSVENKSLNTWREEWERRGETRKGKEAEGWTPHCQNRRTLPT